MSQTTFEVVLNDRIDVQPELQHRLEIGKTEPQVAEIRTDGQGESLRELLAKHHLLSPPTWTGFATRSTQVSVAWSLG